MRIGLVPMSAKPYHRGHHMLVEIAALGNASSAALKGAPTNDEVVVFASYSSRGTKPATKSSGGKERIIPGETPVFGEDMKYIWEKLLIPNLRLPDNVTVRSPADGAPNSPVKAVHEVLSAIHKAKEEGSEYLSVPYTNIIVNPQNVVVTVYSDDVDVEQNYPNDFMEKSYPGSFGTAIKKFGVPRSSTVQISGTKMREMLCNGNKEGFLPMLPDLPRNVAEEIFDTLSTSAINLCPRSNWSKVTERLIRKIVREMI